MGKSAKAKKEKRADFTKVKLKVGRKLPKGQNLTNTSFKAKKIVISEQLKKQAADQPVTKKKLTLKELLSHLRHYSAYVRQDGLTGLQELVTSHPELLLTSLQQVLTATAALLVDEDNKLRTEAVTLITHVIEQVSEQQAAPFFPAVMAHLTCAMTHISAAVRQSSVPLLAALLRRFPALVAARADHVLPTLLQLISRTSGGGQTAQRALLADPDSKLSAAAWRVTVLRQLAQVFRTQPESQSSLAGATAMPTVPARAHVGMPRHPRSPLGLCFTDLEAKNERRVLTDPEELRTYASGLVPLLFQAYAEVAPPRDADGSLLSDAACETLCVAMELLVALLRQMQRVDAEKGSQLVRWLAETYRPELERHVFADFPYSRTVGQRRKATASAAPSALELSSDAVNMLACELSACLGAGGGSVGVGAARTPARAVAQRYLTDYLSSERSGELGRACDVLLTLLADGDGGDGAGGGGAELARRRGCLHAAAERHARLQPTLMKQDGQLAAPLLKLLTAVVTQHRYRSLARCVEVQEWGTQLLPLVSAGCDTSVLDLLRRIAVSADQEFLASLRQHAPSLLLAAAYSSDARWQRHVLELLMWAPCASAAAQTAYEQFVADKSVKESVKKYAQSALDDKYGRRVVNIA